jgi:AraC-like DNA-binding protein
MTGLTARAADRFLRGPCSVSSSSYRRSITAQGLVTLEAFMRSRGLDYLTAARTVGIDPDVAHDPDGRVPLRSIARLLDNVARETGNDAFGAQLGETFQIGTTGTLDYVISNAPTLRVALTDYVRLLALISDGIDTRFEERPRSSYIVTRLPEAFGPRAQLIDATSATRVVRIRYIMRDPSLALLVELERSKPKAIDEFKRIFGTRVSFARPRNRIGIATDTLDRELPAADPHLYKVVVLAAKRALAEREQTADTLFSLISYISAGLPHGDVSIGGAAKAMGLSRHGLRRQLEQARTTFRDLLDQTRKAMADHYINETTLPMTEIAFLLGFSELSAFSRAGKSWFGEAPRDMRKRSGTR